jgi:hypothetical protein
VTFGIGGIGAIEPLVFRPVPPMLLPMFSLTEGSLEGVGSRSLRFPPPAGMRWSAFHSVAVSFPTPITLSAATASFFRAACQASQQRECSQAYPVGSTP